METTPGDSSPSKATPEAEETKSAAAAKSTKTTKSAGAAKSTRTQALESQIAQLSYEEARDKLAEIVRSLEAGNISLEDSLQLWELGEALGKRCQEWLDSARARLEAARAEAENLNEAMAPDGAPTPDGVAK